MHVYPGIKKNKTILVVDDDTYSIELLKLILEVHGYNVITATNGKEGLEKAFIVLPDIIILDVRMPNLNGWQLCKMLKMDRRTESIPVIFFTAYSQKNDFEKSKKMGADLFLNKPLDPDELVQKIGELFDRYHKK